VKKARMKYYNKEGRPCIRNAAASSHIKAGWAKRLDAEWNGSSDKKGIRKRGPMSEVQIDTKWWSQPRAWDGGGVSFRINPLHT